MGSGADTVNDKMYALGVHIGATSRHVALFNLEGEVVAYDNLVALPRRDRPYHDVLKDAAEAVLSTITKAETDKGISRQRIAGGGICVPGTVDSEVGCVRRTSDLPEFFNKYLPEDLNTVLKEMSGISLQFSVENDGNGTCLAEKHFGAGRGERDFLTVLLCYGLGGGMILNGQLYRGATSMAGEIGHIAIHPSGRSCPCGSRGCLETVASGRALLADVRETDSPLAKEEKLRYTDLTEAAARGDAEIERLFATMGTNLGIGLASIINCLNPAKIIISGELARAAKFFMPSAAKQIEHREFVGMQCKVVVSELLEHSQARAALSTFLHFSELEPKDAGNSRA